MLSDAIKYYHSLLSGPLLDDAIEKLAESTARQNLSFGSRPICTVLRPLFITADQYDYIQRDSTLVLRAIEKLGQALLSEERLRAELGLTPTEEQLISIDPGFKAPAAGGRFDAFFDLHGDFSFVEYNADQPGGLLYGETLSEIFQEMDVVREFGRKFPVRQVPVKRQILETMLDCYNEWGNWNSRARPKIALIDSRTPQTNAELELCCEYFASQGYPTVIADPRELEYRGGWLRVGDFHINIVYKGAVTYDLLEQNGMNHPLVRAARDRAVCVVNSFRVQMLGKKALFGLLDNPDCERFFTSDEIGALRRHLPWTRHLRKGFSTYRGRRIDLIDFTLSHRNLLTLKPNNWSGGRGEIPGWSCTEEEWQSAIRNALEGSFVVQELVEGIKQPFPTLVMGELECQDRYVDFDPYTWGGEMVEGAGVRLSCSPLPNVSASEGSATSMMIIGK
ncbi:MAG TPA: hypothetical protein VJ302_21390 [Blastocatellia bacterium]|nr:hypothetical protein [Blastocatellia bacterium]